MSFKELLSELGVLQMGNIIKVASCTIKQLFSADSEPILNENDKDTEISGTLEIPEYQRPYVWEEKQIDKLRLDIKEHFENHENLLYYLGSIILHQHDGKLSIIDGQQRLTTLAIIQHIKDTNEVPKLKYASPTTIDHIKKNYEYLRKMETELKYIDFEKLNVTLVVTNNEDDAYTFFETQNTGGIRLSGVDIIKAHHLRDIEIEDKQKRYASTWESLKNINVVIELLIKARRWNALDWFEVPSYRDEKGTKDSIIEDFSEKTREKKKAATYFQIPYQFAIRQPLANGENFIDYLVQFCDLYQRLFKNQGGFEFPEKYYKFNESIIQKVDGTVFLKELYEIALLSYVNKFGTEKLLEASYWIFRYTYSLRVSNPKVVREDSIPNFLTREEKYKDGKDDKKSKNCNYIFDIILSSFDHEQCISSLKSFKYIFNNENIEKSVKSRFIERVKEYFRNINKDNFDKTLIEAIEFSLIEDK
jgi:hypothetical protein